MIQHFKKSIYTALIGLAIPLAADAQYAPACKIKYNYDAAGNRIKRYYECDPGPGNEQPYDPGSVLSNLFPNPTYGPLTGTFSSPIGGPAGGATVTVATIGGIIVLQQQFLQPATFFNIDLSQQVPGQYFLTVYAFGSMDTYSITKL